MKTFKHTEGELALGEEGIFITHSKAELNIHRSVSPSYWSRRQRILHVCAIIFTIPVLLPLVNIEVSKSIAIGSISGIILLGAVGLYFYFNFKKSTVLYSWESIGQVRLYPSGLLEWLENQHDWRGKRVQCKPRDMSSILALVREVFQDDKIKVPNAWDGRSDATSELKGYNGTRVRLDKEGLSVGSIWFSSSTELKLQSAPPKLELKPNQSVPWIWWPLIILFFLINGYGPIHDMVMTSLPFADYYLGIGLLILGLLPAAWLLFIVTTGSVLGGNSFIVKSEDIQYIEITGPRVIFGLTYKDGMVVDFEATARVKEELESLDEVSKSLKPVTF
ncbi:MAG: hypothetical protein HWD92_01835 [Flavobacteriia bacterium]|nr:hypothetical protein [Flavobacteriia bacterium]